MKKLVIKEGPLVLVTNIIFMEVLISVIFFSLSYIVNYQEFYEQYISSRILRYDIFIMLTFSFAQIFLIMGLFLHWYFSYFEIADTELAHIYGLVRRTRKSYMLNKLHSVFLSQGLLQRTMKHATLTLCFDGDNKVKIRNTATFQEANSWLHRMINNREKKSLSLNTLFSQEENENLEFKETLRFDIKKGEPSKEVEKATLKTIAGFLNAKGGVLVIGVSDKKEIVGLQRDYDTLKRKDRDSFENYLTVLLKDHIGPNIFYDIRVFFEDKNDMDICIVEVFLGKEAVFLKNGDGKEDFYVRVGNSTQPLSMSESQKYIKERF